MVVESVSRLKYTIVVGNGFDLDLKFKTRYSDFVDSEEWNTMYEQRSRNRQYSLLQYLNGKKFIDEWFDIESALLDYVSRRKDGSFVNNVKQDKEDYDSICKSLNNYLKNHIEKSHHSIYDTCAGKILKVVDSLDYRGDVRFYSFNFTPIELYLSVLSLSHFPEVNYVHGTIEESSLILGVEVDDFREMAPGYSFLIKSNNRSYKSSELASDLNNSQEVVFFGHSLNNIDMGYFEEYFKMMERNDDNTKHITIITYDENSKQQLLDNLRKSGISVQKLYTHSHVEVIRTKLVNDNQNNSDTLAFNQLLERLRK